MSYSKTSVIPLKKYERLEARINAEQKNLFQHAADLLGRSLTDFVVSTVQKVALEVIQEREILHLAQNDREVFIDSLLNPVKPNQRLVKAAKNYKKTVNSK